LIDVILELSLERLICPAHLNARGFFYTTKNKFYPQLKYCRLCYNRITMKKVILGLVLLVAAGFMFFNYDWAPNDIEIATISDQPSEEVSDLALETNFISSDYSYNLNSFDFQFTGYGPGKSHKGEISSEISEDGKSVSFDMTSVDTGIEGLDEHLCTDDFFNCSEYPTSNFILNSINPVSPTTARVTGVYELKGIEKNISFVADVIDGSENFSADNLNSSYNGRFMLDTSEFNFKVPIVDNNVLIEFEFSAEAQAKEMPADESTGTTTDDTEVTTE
jgi:polyisoprenoid-binding protein YceI